MITELFDYHLPDGTIATAPLMPREAAKLLKINAKNFFHHHVGDLPGLLRPGDVMVFNDSRVLPARLLGVREGDATRAPARIEFTLHKPNPAPSGPPNGEVPPSPLQLIAAMPGDWRGFARPGKKLRVGDRLRISADFTAQLLEKHENGEISVRFNYAGAALRQALHRYGTMPLPPYLHRAATAEDDEHYQTVFAKSEGSVAAPTAGLHISPELLTRLSQRGIGLEYVTLHIGAGTFLPVKVADTVDHVMHSEVGIIAPDVAARLNQVRREGGRIIACGTTALRVLEAAAAADGMLHPFAAETSIFITPGYRFRCIQGLLTNFHLPKSSLIMLVAALIGLERTHEAYRLAIASGYRFYSFGDACLLLPDQEG
ncbi:MAG: tRNA preQ1(34) S-adenosylmethionine ribosyltransferase-isomerase QueA [Candidatus Symbiobacter sp.]|nr:tRNA preQ1(34) S-adenosylmethionine ribosyltransferase-isomerase QueA [Candidatus Symbiobacter sp.]